MLILKKLAKELEAQGHGKSLDFDPASRQVSRFKTFLKVVAIALLSSACVWIVLSSTPHLFRFLLILLSVPMAIIATLAP